MTEPRPGAEELAAQARSTLSGRLHGVLSTLSLDMPGYPFGSVVPYCLGRDGAPLFLLSRLAQHTKNLLTNSNASFTVYQSEGGDVAQAARLTGIGQVLPLDAGDGSAERYFRYYPRSRSWYEMLDFEFFQLSPERWHFNGGFATARRFGNERILRPALLSADEEAALTTEISHQRPSLLIQRLKTAGIQVSEDDDIRLCGIDGEGMDICLNTVLHRVPHGAVADSAPRLHALLQEMATD